VIRTVVLTPSLRKELTRAKKKIPPQVIDKFLAWVQMVERDGLEEVQKISGFHDEPLQGKRRGQRSLRLNDGYRAFYVIKKDEVRFVEVFDVNNHDY
jgi:toxin HigB-1